MTRCALAAALLVAALLTAACSAEPIPTPTAAPLPAATPTPDNVALALAHHDRQRALWESAGVKDYQIITLNSVAHWLPPAAIHATVRGGRTVRSEYVSPSLFWPSADMPGLDELYREAEESYEVAKQHSPLFDFTVADLFDRARTGLSGSGCPSGDVGIPDLTCRSDATVQYHESGYPTFVLIDYRRTTPPPDDWALEWVIAARIIKPDDL